MLTAWMALERRPFPLVAPLDFIVTVNKGTEAPDCWIFLPQKVTWFLRVWGPLAESELLRDRTCCTLNYICDFLGMRDVDCVAGACDFDRVALGPLAIPTFQVRADGSIASRH